MEGVMKEFKDVQGGGGVFNLLYVHWRFSTILGEGRSNLQSKITSTTKLTRKVVLYFFYKLKLNIRVSTPHSTLCASKSF